MLVEFRKWGSLAVRIPKAVAETLKVGVGRQAEIAIENGALVLRADQAAQTQADLHAGGIAERNDQGKRAAGGRLGRPTRQRGLVTWRPIALTSATSFGSIFSRPSPTSRLEDSRR